MATKYKQPRQPRMKFNLIKVAGFFKIVLAVLTIALMHWFIDLGLTHADQIMSQVDSVAHNIMEFDFDLIHVCIMVVGAGIFIWGHFTKKNNPSAGKWLTATADVFTITLFASHTMFDYSAGGFVLTCIVLLIMHFITKAALGQRILLPIFLLILFTGVGLGVLNYLYTFLDTYFDILSHIEPEQLAFYFCWLIWLIIYIVQICTIFRRK